MCKVLNQKRDNLTQSLERSHSLGTSTMRENEFQLAESFTEQSEIPCKANIGLTETEVEDNVLSRGLFVQLPSID